MVALLLFVLIAGFIVFFAILSSAAERRVELRRLVDSLRRGTLAGAGEPVDLEHATAVPFRLGGRKARLLLPASGGRTVVEVGEGAFAGGSLHVFESGAHDVAAEWVDRDIGDPVFDRAWVVQGDLADRVFAAESRANSVAAIHALRKYLDPCVEVRQGLLRVSVGQSPESELTVRKLLQAAEAVLESVGPRVAEGVLWIEVRHDAVSVCQVCGSDDEGRRVVCRSCRTPHHADCWTYAGRCSTYGCGGKETVRT
ncbi:MAG TPA: hypothetical protein VF950_17680 [Planctomycetota bacterium]